MHLMKRSLLLIAFSGLFVWLLAACQGGNALTLRIVSGSENNTLEPIIKQWATDKGYNVEMTYLGSLDIARMLQTGQIEYDAVWPANRLWIDYGDRQNIVNDIQSIMLSPVIFGVKRSVAERLGWTTGDVTMSDILTATEAGSLRFMMTSATQSNSGASFYFGALTAFAGSPNVITSADLSTPDVQDQITRILGTVNRSAGSSGWLKDLFLKDYDRFDAMVNYESVIIETNQELERTGREPLYAVYPIDGLSIADSPLGFVSHGDENIEKAFLELQQYLLSEATQRELLKAGRRTALIGINLTGADTSVFRTDWGIDVERIIQPIRFPGREVISEALNLYQTAFRKPSCTVYVLDYSGSMGSNGGETEMKAAMRTLLDPDIASQYLLQSSPRDINTAILFNAGVINEGEFEQWTVAGSDAAELRELYRKIESVNADGDTNIFGAALAGLQWLEQEQTEDCLPAVIVMTDGQDNYGLYPNLEAHVRRTENDIPIFAITFGGADTGQLQPMVDLTSGRIFDGTKNLVDAFRSAKGYN